MKLRVVGTNCNEGEPYYLRDEFDIERALHDGFSIHQDDIGWVYGDPTKRCAFHGWTARPVPEPVVAGSQEGVDK